LPVLDHFFFVLSCFFRVHPLGGLFLAHAEAGLHCTVQYNLPTAFVLLACFVTLVGGPAPRTGKHLHLHINRYVAWLKIR